MTEPIKEFDRDRYVGQVHAWVTDNGKTINGKPLVSVYICRRYTNEEYNDDDQWGCWLHVTGLDCTDIALKLLHFCDACRYEVVSLNAAHANDPDSPHWEVEAIGNSVALAHIVMSNQIYRKFRDEADATKDALADMGSKAKDEIRSLFDGFAEAQQLGLGPQ